MVSSERALAWGEELRQAAKKNKDQYALELTNANALIIRQQILLNRYEANLQIGELFSHYNNIAQSVTFLEQIASHVGQNILQIAASSRFKLGSKLISLLKGKILRQKNTSAPWAPEETAAIITKINHWKDLYQKRKALNPTLDNRTYSSDELQKKVAEFQKAVIERINDCSFLGETIETLEKNLHAILSSAKYRLGSFLINDILKRLTPGAKRNVPWAPEEALQLIDRFKLWRELQVESCFTPVPFEQYLAAKNLGSIPPELIRKSIPSKHIRVTQFTPAETRNPYYTMIPQQLISLGWNYEFDHNFESILNKLNLHQYDTEIVHFHQLEPYYHSESGNLSETKQKADELLTNLTRLKTAGAKLVWTQHNPLPHDRTFAEVDKFLLENVSPLVDHIVVLGNKAKTYMEEYSSAKRISVLEHPSFRNYYGEPALREIARVKFGIPADIFVFGSPGELKPYKNLENIIAAINELATSSPSQQIKLLLAGPATSEKYVQSLRKLGKDNIIIIDRPLADDEIPEIMSAIDAAVFSFKDIFASSGVVLALSYNLPTIAPDLGCLGEYVINNNTGLLYEHNNLADMVAKMKQLLSSELAEHMRYMCNEFNREYAVANVATRFEEMYLDIANQ